MSVAFLIIGDGRDEVHERAHESLIAWVEHAPVVGGDDRYPRIVVDDRDHKFGFAGAIQHGWNQITALEPFPQWVFHFEADFIFLRTVPIDRWVRVLSDHPHLAQIALKRQPVNEEEKAAGGIVETDPDSFTQVVEAGDIWTEHRRCFTTNPCLYPAALCHQGWPQLPESEGRFTHRLLADEKVRFAFWGAKHDPPAIEHIGERVGHGY